MTSDVMGLVDDYLRDRLSTQPAARHLDPVRTAATILVVGSYSFGMNRPGSDLDLELILPDDVFADLVTTAGGPRGLWVHDVSHHPLVDIKVRPVGWLARRLGDGSPEALWVYQRALIVQDPAKHLSGLLVKAGERFQDRLGGIVLERYRDFRSAVTLGECRDRTARHVLLGKAIESALVLPLLARGAPHPYPKWQSWWLSESHADGATIGRLCGQLIDDEEGFARRFGELRAMIDGILTAAGHGDSLVRDFWRRL